MYLKYTNYSSVLESYVLTVMQSIENKRIIVFKERNNILTL